LDKFVPDKSGIFVDTEKRVMGGYNVGQLLKESADHVVVKELLVLHDYLSEKAESNIGISNNEMLKRYLITFRRCVDAVSAHRQAIENSQSATFYMKCSLENSCLLDISQAYEVELRDAMAWYDRQMGTGGDALSLGKRIRLPTMDSGLAGLGIQKE